MYTIHAPASSNDDREILLCEQYIYLKKQKKTEKESVQMPSFALPHIFGSFVLSKQAGNQCLKFNSLIFYMLRLTLRHSPLWLFVFSFSLGGFFFLRIEIDTWMRESLVVRSPIVDESLLSSSFCCSHFYYSSLYSTI